MATALERPLNPHASPFQSSTDRKNDFTSNLQNFLIGDPNAVSFLSNQLIFLNDKISYLDSLFNQRLLTDFRKRFTLLEREIQFLNQENLDLRYQLAITEDATKSLQLRLEGLKENDQESLISHVTTILSLSGVVCLPADIDYVRRLGKHKPGSPRPILIKFMRQSQRDAILYNRANININSTSTDLVWLNDEVSSFTRRNRKTVRDVATLANSMGVENVRIHGDGIVIGNGKYKHRDLDLLPPLLTATNAKTIQTDTDIFFQSELSPFSNFYMSRFEDQNSQIFECLEQAFQFRKATYHNNHQLANKILATRNPYEHKRLGNLVDTSQSWRESEADCMSELLLYKFTQNNQVAEQLMATGQKRLHEALSDNKWATGSDLSSKATQNGTWTGGDLLGQLLEGTRDTITRANHTPTPSPSPPSNDQSQPSHPIHDDLLPIPDDDEEHQPIHPTNSSSLNSSSLTQTQTLQRPIIGDTSSPTFSSPPPNSNQIRPLMALRQTQPQSHSQPPLPPPNPNPRARPIHHNKPADFNPPPPPPTPSPYTTAPPIQQHNQPPSRHPTEHVITAQPFSPRHNLPPPTNSYRSQTSKLALTRLSDSSSQPPILSQDSRSSRSATRSSQPVP